MTVGQLLAQDAVSRLLQRDPETAADDPIPAALYSSDSSRMPATIFATTSSGGFRTIDVW